LIQEKENELKICIIGCGRLGLTLALAISKANNPKISIVSAASRTDKSLNYAKRILNKYKENILFTKDNLLAASVSNCIFICTPDDKIQQVCEEISTRSNLKQKSVIYFSGLKKISILDLAKKAGASVACMHPIKSFANVLQSVKTLSGTLYGITYDKEDMNIQAVINKLLNLLNGKSIYVEDNKKALYHISACIASNFLVSLIDTAIETGKLLELNPEIFLNGLLNLSEGTLKNIKKVGSKKALTGPIARGDLDTIKEHINSLKELDRNDLLLIYKCLGEKTAKIALENEWINNKIYQDLLLILNN
jgi:predicted short-subunit dehydrogenase-like oxidoreductase (DUF2520 family)